MENYMGNVCGNNALAIYKPDMEDKGKIVSLPFYVVCACLCSGDRELSDYIRKGNPLLFAVTEGFIPKEKTPLSEDILAELRDSGDSFLAGKAKEHLAASYERYIRGIASKRFSTYCAHYEDLLQCGMIGLLKAFMAYDQHRPKTGKRENGNRRLGSFSFYASRYIVHEMSLYIYGLSGTNFYYLSLQKKIRKALDEIGKEGLPGSTKNMAAVIARKAGLSERVTRRELRVMGTRCISYEAFSERISSREELCGGLAD